METGWLTFARAFAKRAQISQLLYSTQSKVLSLGFQWIMTAS
jgi:hypothetical protein